MYLEDIKPIEITKNSFTPQTVDYNQVYKYGGASIGYVSRYPNYNPDRDNEEYFAQQQSGGEKFLNSFKGMVTLGAGAFVVLVLLLI